jgi:hypothetical protein
MQSQMARCFFAFLATFLLLIAESVGAQGKAPRIGFLVVGSAASVSSRVDAFREGFANAAISKAKTLSSSIGTVMENQIAWPNRRLIWSSKK